MDPLTHTATGLFLSRAGLNRWTPHATPVLLLAANAPDIDILAAGGGGLCYLQFHRHITHSLLLAPVLAVFAVLVVRAAGGRSLRWGPAFLAALAGVASHLLLDLTNMYGIRLLLPFSGEWLRLDLTGLIDPWIWAALAVALAAPWLSRLVASEIASGNVRRAPFGRGWAIFALLFLLLYNGGRAVLHARAVAVLDARIYQGGAPLRVAALPEPNPLRWRGIVETADFYAVQDFSLADDFDPGRSQVFYKAPPEPALDAARATPAFRAFLGFSQYPLWRVTAADLPENARQVQAIDMRFGTPLAPAFTASALVDSADRVLRSSFTWVRVRPR